MSQQFRFWGPCPDLILGYADRGGSRGKTNRLAKFLLRHAERVGRERTYINRIEKGETDLQLSSFIRIAAALGIMLRLDVNLA